MFKFNQKKSTTKAQFYLARASSAFLFLGFLLATSCQNAILKRESPVIYFSNSSDFPIRDIECSWAQKNNLSLPVLNPGESRSESFYIGGGYDFFGLVNLSWRNSRGEIIQHEFFLNRNNLPSFNDSTTYNYVQLYLDQGEVEITTSDAPDLAGKTRKMDRILAHHRNNYAQGHKQTETSLIRVQTQPQRDTALPSWIGASF
jgi:hypothetical protein